MQKSNLEIAVDVVNDLWEDTHDPGFFKLKKEYALKKARQLLAKLKLDEEMPIGDRQRPCSICGRRFPDTVINVEGWIHHGGEWKCLNAKECSRYKKKHQ